MKKIVFTGGILAALMSGTLVQAQDAKDGQLTISGQIKPRFEFRDGFKKPLQEGEEPAAFMEQRSRINLLYKASDFNVKLSMQDVRIWGDVGQINKSDGLASFHEAYGEWTPKPNMALKIGRQELVYNDARILGNLDWAAQGRSHDAIKFVYKDSLWEAHIIATYNQDATVQEPAKLQSATAGDFVPTGTSAIGFKLPYPYMTQIGYFKYDNGKASIPVLLINDVIQKTSMTGNVDRLTVGIDPQLKLSKFKLNASAYFQTGKVSDNMKSTGYMASLQATYTGGKKVTPTFGIDFLSGNDTTTKDVLEGFDPLYGTHHAFYGYMDYFYVGNGHGTASNPAGANQTSASSGLIDLYVKTAISLGKPGKLMANLHSFISPAKNYNDLKPTEEVPFLGTELDLVYAKSLGKNIKLNVGTSFLVATDGMKSLKGSSVNGAGDAFNAYTLNNWSWAMIDFTF